MSIREDAQFIIDSALQASMPDVAVEKALKSIQFPAKGRIYLVAAGKAAWQMASAATKYMGARLSGGVVVTKYGHVKAPLKGVKCFEAGHPIPDENGYQATEEAIKLVSNLTERDSVLFLLSGGGSALFEKPLIPPAELTLITKQLLACGADIVEINTIRKRLSCVKGGRFAEICAPARVYSVILSDIIGDPLDMIASGPAYPDASTSEEAMEIVKRHSISVSENAIRLLKMDTPKKLSNVTTFVTGSVTELCHAAEAACYERGYAPMILTTSLACEAREAGSFLASVAAFHQGDYDSIAIIVGGETVVHLKGNGKGGRNQEIALSASIGISGFKDTALFSVGSDGTDGPTDAAGGYADGETYMKLKRAGVDARRYLSDNNAYNALKAVDGLIMTGPTGTNVNDLTVLLINR